MSPFSLDADAAKTERAALTAYAQHRAAARLTEGQESNQQDLIGEMETNRQQKAAGGLDALLEANVQPVGSGHWAMLGRMPGTAGSV